MKQSSRIAVGITLALGLTISASLAGAAPAPKVVIEDPINDANGLNDQGTGDGSMGDNETPADASSVTDITAITIANDAKNLFIAIETEAGPPGTQGVGYRVRANPDGAAGAYCLVFEVLHPGAGNTLTAAEAQLRDTCTGETTPIEVLGNTLTIPRSANPAFAKGATLKAPQALAFVYAGSSAPAGAPVVFTDTTKVGTDYKFVDKKKK